MLRSIVHSQLTRARPTGSCDRRRRSELYLIYPGVRQPPNHRDVNTTYCYRGSQKAALSPIGRQTPKTPLKDAKTTCGTLKLYALVSRVTELAVRVPWYTSTTAQPTRLLATGHQDAVAELPPKNVVFPRGGRDVLAAAERAHDEVECCYVVVSVRCCGCGCGGGVLCVDAGGEEGVRENSKSNTTPPS